MLKSIMEDDAGQLLHIMPFEPLHLYPAPQDVEVPGRGYVAFPRPDQGCRRELCRIVQANFGESTFHAIG
jgi:hypothetical protein